MMPIKLLKSYKILVIGFIVLIYWLYWRCSNIKRLNLVLTRIRYHFLTKWLTKLIEEKNKVLKEKNKNSRSKRSTKKTRTTTGISRIKWFSKQNKRIYQ